MLSFRPPRNSAFFPFLIARKGDVYGSDPHRRLHLGLRGLAVDERTSGHKDQRQLLLFSAHRGFDGTGGIEGKVLRLEFTVSMRTHSDD